MNRSLSPPKNQKSVSRFLRVSSPIINRCQHMSLNRPMSFKSKKTNDQLKNLNECSHELKSYRTSLKNSLSNLNTLNQINTELNKKQQHFYQNHQINQKQSSTCPIMIYQIKNSNGYFKSKKNLPLPPIEHRKCKSQQSEDKNRLKKNSSFNSVTSSPSIFTATSTNINHSIKKKNNFVSNFLIKNKLNNLNEKFNDTNSTTSLNSYSKKNHTKKTRKNVVFKSDYAKESRVDSSNDSYCSKTNEYELSNFLNEINSENDVDYCYDFTSNLRFCLKLFKFNIFIHFCLLTT